MTDVRDEVRAWLDLNWDSELSLREWRERLVDSGWACPSWPTEYYGLLGARADWDAPKHRGITYFAFPMRQAGVEVRPLKQMNGYQSFNEVFMSEARVSADDVVGEVGGGWPVAVFTLGVERASF